MSVPIRFLATLGAAALLAHGPAPILAQEAAAPAVSPPAALKPY